MRYVVTNPYHLWAHQAQSHARNQSGNRSFRDNMAFSYAAEIGRVVTNKKGVRAYYMNSATYSVTTSKHQSELNAAIRGQELVFRFPWHNGSRTWGHNDNTADNPRAIYQYMLTHIAELLGKAKRARTYKEYHLRQAAELRETVAKFVKFHGLRYKPLSDEGFEDLEARIEAARVARVANERAANKARQEAQAAREAKAAADFAEKLPKWLAGENVHVSFGYSGPAYLRIIGDTVQTSQGAEAPLDHVRKALPLVLRAIRAGVSFRPEGGHTIRLGHYTLSEVNADTQTVRAGCHTFAFAEILRFAGTVPAATAELTPA